MDHWQEIERHDDDGRQLIDDDERRRLEELDCLEDGPGSHYEAWLAHMSREERDEGFRIDYDMRPPPHNG